MVKNFDTFNFLKEYQKHPCLWDKSISDNKNRSKRDAAEEILLPLSGLCNIKELRQKIRSLRCTYNQELAKIKASLRTGAETNSIYKPSLAWFELAHSFLCKNNEDTEVETISVSNVPENIVNVTEYNTIKQDDTDFSEALPYNVEKNYTEKSNVKFITLKRAANTENKPNKQQKINSSLENTVETLKCACSQKLITNEYSIFGQHVAAQLEKLPLETSLKLQMEIQNMLTEARLSTLNNIHQISDNSSTSSLTPSNISLDDNSENYLALSISDVCDIVKNVIYCQTEYS